MAEKDAELRAVQARSGEAAAATVARARAELHDQAWKPLAFLGP